jgi:AcrR family transcriptional regulator
LPSAACRQERAPSSIRTIEIAERMGVTQPALFRHFPTKEALWQAALLRSHATLVSQRPGVARLLLHELQNPRPSEGRAEVERFLARFRALLAQLQGLVLQGLLAGDLTPLPRQLEAVLPLLLPGLAEGP